MQQVDCNRRASLFSPPFSLSLSLLCTTLNCKLDKRWTNGARMASSLRESSSAQASPVICISLDAKCRLTERTLKTYLLSLKASKYWLRRCKKQTQNSKGSQAVAQLTELDHQFFHSVTFEAKSVGHR